MPCTCLHCRVSPRSSRTAVAQSIRLAVEYRGRAFNPPRRLALSRGLVTLKTWSNKVGWLAAHEEQRRCMQDAARREFELYYTAERNHEMLLAIYERARQRLMPS